MTEILASKLPAGRANPSGGKHGALMDAARALEGAFLSQMLKSAGVGTPRGTLGGGAGEEQFSSMLRDVYARDLVQAGGIGLAESIYRSLAAGGTDAR